ncbi:MAG: polymer-forming cytoskeletal protein [Thermaerobacter sp.]|nr:polymer-forming cytoskeletal protein [Thermaerobacter sp.]
MKAWMFLLLSAVILAGPATVLAAASGSGPIDQIGGSVRVPAGVTVSGIRMVGGPVTVDGTVTGGVRVVGGPLRVDGQVDGDVHLVGGPLLVGPHGRILGTVTLVGGPPVLSPGAYVPHLSIKPGGLSWGGLPWPSLPAYVGYGLWMGWRLAQWVLFLALGIAVLALWPRQVEAAAAYLVEFPGRSAAIGLVAILAGLSLMVILAITLVGIPLSLLLLLFLAAAAVFGKIALSLLLGRRVLDLAGRSGALPVWGLVAGSLVLFLLGLIPWLGILVWLAVFLFSLGVCVGSFFGTGWNPFARGAAS